MNITLLVVCIIIIYFVVMFSVSENFETNKERDDANKDYFQNKKEPNYEDYRDSVPGGNIVDYMSYRGKYV